MAKMLTKKAKLAKAVAREIASHRAAEREELRRLQTHVAMELYACLGKFFQQGHDGSAPDALPANQLDLWRAYADLRFQVERLRHK